MTGAPLNENKNMPVQFQYIDVGVSIDARDAREIGDKLALSLNADYQQPRRRNQRRQHQHSQ
jgi:hypothetical protein